MGGPADLVPEQSGPSQRAMDGPAFTFLETGCAFETKAQPASAPAFRMAHKLCGTPMSKHTDGVQTPTLPAETRLKIANRDPGKLKAYAGNARTHSEKQITQIAASIRTFGFLNPVLIGSDGIVIAGHAHLPNTGSKRVNPAIAKAGLKRNTTFTRCYSGF